MKIVDIETYVVGAGWKNWLFVRVLTDENLEGIGEATLNGLTHACEAAVHELKHLVVGLDPRQVRNISLALFERVSNEGGHIHRAAIAGIEVACWDLLGKSFGVPIYQLLGGKIRDSIDCYANGWYRGERTADGFASAAHAAVNMGFKALKVDPFGTAKGFLNPEQARDARELLHAVRSAVGANVRLMVDLHARLAPSEAVSFIESCLDLDVFWWEEPTTREREQLTNEIAGQTKARIATGETFHCIGQFMTLAAEGNISIFQPEPMSLGGIAPTIAVSDIAAANGAWIAPHQSGGPVATAVCLQLAALVPNFLIQEYFDPFNEPWTNELVSCSPALDIVSGRISLPKDAGLGVKLNLEVVRAHPYDPKAYLDVTSAGWEHRLGARKNTREKNRQ